MRKAILFLLVCLSIFVLIIRFGYKPLSDILGLQQRAGVRIDSTPGSQVSVDNNPLGNTPVQKEDLSAGEHLVALSSSQGSWSGYVKLNSGTLTVVNRDLEPTEASSSGEIITLNPGKGVTITSDPAASDVEIDGNPVGKTPLSLANISSGEHLFTISHPSYSARSIRASLVDGYNLTLSVDLAISAADLTQTAQNAPAPSPSPEEVVVTQTPNGFLRIREQASTSSKVVGQASSGDTLTLLQEQSGWDKIQTKDGVVGYVSTQYIQKKTQ